MRKWWHNYSNPTSTGAISISKSQKNGNRTRRFTTSIRNPSEKERKSSKPSGLDSPKNKKNTISCRRTSRSATIVSGKSKKSSKKSRQITKLPSPLDRRRAADSETCKKRTAS